MSDGPVNEADLDWTDHDHGDRTFKRKQIGDAAGGEQLGASLYAVPPGKRLWVRHYHEGNEEAIFVRGGTGTLRLGPEAEEHTLERGDYSGSEAKAHPFTGVAEADNWASLYARSHGWIFHAEMSNVYVIKNTMLTYVESGCHSDTQSEYLQPLASL